ncbi:MAG: hypothetical protein HY907_19040 [Deltaproteobacteria bacterium]|nr:hypothetical protein [Deltaproteobacteria bacterium]
MGTRRFGVPAALVAAAVTGGAACYSSGRMEGDADPEDGSGGDAAEGGDVAGDDGGVCEGSSHWELVPWPIDGVELVNAPSRYGGTDRLRLRVRAPSYECYRLGRVDVDVMTGDATDFVTLTAYVWRHVGDVLCADLELDAAWIVEIEGRQQGNWMAVVADGHAAGGEDLLRYGRETCSVVPDCACYSGTPPGPGLEWNDCLTDCSCASGLSCLGYWGMEGPLASCLRGCNDFLDCGAEEWCQEPVPDGVPWICASGDQCSDGRRCPSGFTCVTDTGDAWNRCVDLRGAPTVVPCASDADCAVGELCVLGLRPTPTCEIPCPRDEDCPGRGDGVLVCGTASICVPLGG